MSSSIISLHFRELNTTVGFHDIDVTFIRIIGRFIEIKKLMVFKGLVHNIDALFPRQLKLGNIELVHEIEQHKNLELERSGGCFCQAIQV